MNLKNKRIVVTGGTSGIGLEVCKEIYRHGGEFIAIGRNGVELNTFIKEAGIKNSKFLPFDLHKVEDIKDLTEEIGQLDGVVHCAGIVKTLPLQYYSIEEYDEINKINLISISELMSLLIKNKKLNRSSSVVFISSISGKYAMKGNALYSMTKAGLSILSASLAGELAKKDIRCNTISPGMVETEITKNAEKQLGISAIETDRKKYPLGYGKPSQIAKPIIFLLSDYSSWITGVDITIDGGRTAIL